MRSAKEDVILQVYIILISLMLIIRDIAGVGINKYIFVFIAAVCMALVPRKYMAYMLTFSFPLFCGLPAAHIRLAAILIYIMKRKKITIQQAAFCVFVILWESLASVYYNSIVIGDILGYLSAPIMLFMFLWEKEDHDTQFIDVRRSINLFLGGFALVCFVIITVAFIKSPSNLLTAFSKGLFRASVTELDQTAEGVTIAMNANTLGYFCCTCSALSILLFNHIKRKNGTSKISYIFIAIGFSIVGVFTLSRTTILLLGIVYLLFVISSMKTVNSTVFAIIGSIIIVAGGYFFISSQPQLFESLFGRFSDKTLYTAGGRTDLFEAYMDVFLSNTRYMILGTGVVQYQAVAGLWNSIHNGTEQILVCMGIPGFVIFMLGIILPIRNTVRKRKNKLLFEYWIPLIAVVVFAQTIQFLNPTILMFPYIMGFFAVKLGVES